MIKIDAGEYRLHLYYLKREIVAMATLWYGGNIYTLIEEGHQVEAVLTMDNRIIATGSLEEIERKYNDDIKVKMNLEGSTMLPGFVDSHLHLIGHGEKLIRLDLTNYSSKLDVLEAVRQCAEKTNQGEWIIGEGWNENLWDEPVPIVLDEIDKVAPNHPVLLKRVCRHAIVVNSLAISNAGLLEDQEYDLEGVIEKDEAGCFNGIFKEKAQDLILKVIPEASVDFIKKALRAAIQDAHKKGLTGVHTEDLAYYNGFEETYKIFKDVIEEEGFAIRAHLLVHHKVMNDFKNSDGRFLKGNDWVEFGAVKIFTDGSLGGRTALLSRPYADDPSTNGVAIFSQQELNNLVARARELNMTVAIHAIGDRASEMSLTAIELNPLRGEGKDRLIHAQILRKDLIERIKRLPIILDIQPTFVASDFPWVIERIGEENMDYCYAWKTLIKEDIPCAGGSDAPVEEISPLLGIHAAVNRMDKLGKVHFPKESLSVYDAVCLYTKGSAKAANHEQDRGMIKAGHLSDFTIIRENIFECATEAIKDISVVKTVIGGKVVYKSA